jgi:hypothetical protein
MYATCEPTLSGLATNTCHSMIAWHPIIQHPVRCLLNTAAVKSATQPINNKLQPQLCHQCVTAMPLRLWLQCDHTLLTPASAARSQAGAASSSEIVLVTSSQCRCQACGLRHYLDVKLAWGRWAWIAFWPYGCVVQKPELEVMWMVQCPYGQLMMVTVAVSKCHARCMLCASIHTWVSHCAAVLPRVLSA